MTDTPPDDVRPVTAQRILATLRALGYGATEVTDGVFGGRWEGSSFTVTLTGDNADVLQVRGTWREKLEADLAAGIHQVLNDWNRDRIWPKVFTRPSGDGLRVHADVSVPVGDGVSDAQLAEIVACGFQTGSQFFAALAELLDP